MRSNPFYELYLADSTSEHDYVRLFSPELIPHVQAVFMPGNVVITGMQGAGKSMLLTLLRLKTRYIYEREKVVFPVPDEMRNFISCSVNLSHSNAIDFGQRSWPHLDAIEVQMLFGDFVNALLIHDLLETLSLYANQIPNNLKKEVGFMGDHTGLDTLARASGENGFWHGWFSGVGNFAEMQEKIIRRIHNYSDFLNRRSPNLDETISSTKAAFGDPLGEFVTSIKELEIVSEDTKFFIDIDQYEELGNIKRPELLSKNECVDYRAVINRALSRRDRRVSYRIGTRPHSWRTHAAQIMGSTGRLEEERDYKYVDLDLLLKRQEHRRTYIFPSFARDVFRRRLSVARIIKDPSEGMESIYGKNLTPAEKAKYYNPNKRPKGIKVDRENWRPETVQRIEQLASKNLLSARLGEAWVRQKKDRDDLNVRNGELPWEKKQSEWWRKERIQLALLQLASSNQQRPIYSGTDEIIDLSNGNILTFISINQHIWDQYIRYESQLTAPHIGLPKIGIDLQSLGILKASEHWFNKMSEETGRSAERIRFVREIARVLRIDFMNDRSLTNPGATNGFSIKVEELDHFPAVKTFLEELSDYGNLNMLEHTTKEKNRAPRFKWYISPILCPHLKLPYQRIKEPKYIDIKQALYWVESSQLNLDKLPRGGRKNSLAEPIQASLF